MASEKVTGEGIESDIPEYLEFRCCMCPNVSNPQNTVCPAGGPQKKPETPCRFVVTYTDEYGYTVSIVRGLTDSGKADWFTGRRKTKNTSQHRIKSHRLPARESFDYAQADLNAYAKAKGWRLGKRIKESGGNGFGSDSGVDLILDDDDICDNLYNVRVL